MTGLSSSTTTELIVDNRRLSSMQPMERLSALRAPRLSRTTRSSRAIDSFSVESTWSIGDRTSEITMESSSPEIRSAPRATSSRSVSPLVECPGGAYTILTLSVELGSLTDFSFLRSDNRTLARTFGGTVSNNVLSSGSGGYFGFGISRALSLFESHPLLILSRSAVGGHNGATVTGNSAPTANFGGQPSNVCFTSLIPKSQAFIVGSSFDFALCYFR